MKVAIGADHAGFELKGEIVSWLESEGHQVNDTGAHKYDPDDDGHFHQVTPPGQLLQHTYWAYHAQGIGKNFVPE